MSFHTENTLAGYARAAVDLRIRMAEVAQTVTDHAYVRELVAGRLAATPELDSQATVHEDVIDAVGRATKAAWAHGDSFVLAPAMTAIVAAAAEALDLTDDLLTAESAPCDSGVLFLPEPIYHRRPTGTVAAVGALTWTLATTHSGQQSWLICAYSPLHDPDDPNAARTRRTLAAAPHLRASLGPYLLNDFDLLPIARPVSAAPAPPVIDDADLNWQSTPDGRYVITDDGMRTQVATAILYAFWCIQAQPITVAATPPLDRPARRRAARACITHDTRVVMLRRTSSVGEQGDGEAKWHYRVRFVVKGHWRRLHDKDGNPYRIWIHAYIKGPDGAPLLHGEKVAVLAR
ncbi:hypothetical protein EDC02_5011 [Micromonospora sp. Llam0]|uniref:hypothetical protein n=1 Tax=Micromonospora sp. Llam0 TaxID=2485143 RepID=UPI000F494AF7|nr:hypothetical protein [Micromonospora sp. Llam0]ROO63002.1 hypothetical protein EDC02_5011 [Micromonospora sp. Llam0]